MNADLADEPDTNNGPYARFCKKIYPHRSAKSAQFAFNLTIDTNQFRRFRCERRFAVVEKLVELFLDAAVTRRYGFYDRLEASKIVEFGVEQVRAKPGPEAPPRPPLLDAKTREKLPPLRSQEKLELEAVAQDGIDAVEPFQDLLGDVPMLQHICPPALFPLIRFDPCMKSV